MTITWYNNANHKHNCEISEIADIECYEATDEKGKLFGVCIRKDKVLLGGILAEFRSKGAQEKLFADIQQGLKCGLSDFEVRKSFYERPHVDVKK